MSRSSNPTPPPSLPLHRPFQPTSTTTALSLTSVSIPTSHTPPPSPAIQLKSKTSVPIPIPTTTQPIAPSSPHRRRRKPLPPIKLDDSVPAVHFRFPIVFPPSPDGKSNQDSILPIPTPSISERPVTPVPSPLPSRLKPTEDVPMVDAPEDTSDISHSSGEHSAAAGLAGMRLCTPDPASNAGSYNEPSIIDGLHTSLGSEVLSSSAPPSMRCEVLHYPLLLPHIMRQKPVIRSRKYYTRPRERNVTVSVTTQSILERKHGGGNGGQVHSTSNTPLHSQSPNMHSTLHASVQERFHEGFHSDDGRKRRSPASSPFTKKRTLKGRVKAGTPTPQGSIGAGLGYYAEAKGLGPAASPSQSQQAQGPETIVRFGQVLKRLCKCCGATKSPQGTWRTGWEETVVLCNGCGLRYKNTKVYCKNCSYIPTKGELTAGHMVCKKCGNELTRNTNPPPGSGGKSSTAAPSPAPSHAQPQYVPAPASGPPPQAAPQS